MASLTISTLLSRPTKAESFLSQTTCRVVDLLGINCTPTSTQPTRTSPALSQSTPAQPKPTSSPVQPRSPQPTTQTTPVSGGSEVLAPIEMNETLLEKIPAIQALDSETIPQSIGSNGDAKAYAVPMINGRNNTQGILGISANAPLQSSTEGWKVFGIAWYWWAILIITMVAASIMFNRQRISGIKEGI